MRRLLILIPIILINFNIYSISRIPLLIDSQETVFRKIALDIDKRLPQQTDILIFRIMTLNANKATDEKINENFRIIMKTQQFIYKYTIEFINEVLNDPKYTDSSTDYSFINNYDETELLSYARFLKKDAILLASVTILDESKKSVWDGALNKFVDKKAALIQGNVLYTETGESLLRFSYYFLVD
jgi:hypothetical protein